MATLTDGAVLVVADAPDARQTLGNICSLHPESVRRFGRAALFEATEFGAFLAFRMRAKHGDGAYVYRTAPVDDGASSLRRAREAAVAFENRGRKSTPYPKFAAGTAYPLPEEMRERPLDGAGERAADGAAATARSRPGPDR